LRERGGTAHYGSPTRSAALDPDAMKLLLLEDDAVTREHVGHALTAAGHVVDPCANGPDAVFLGTSNSYDALVVDRMVPTLDGLSVVKALRAAGVRSPVIFLTAMDGIEDRVAGLEAGGDDYLVKPYAVSELLARLNALARRAPLAETVTVRRFDDLEIDLVKRTVTRAGRRIDLQAQEYKLLEYLSRHPGEIVTRAMLLENVWSFHFDPKTNVIETHMSRLRAKVDRGFARELIQTVRGSGYRIDDA